MIELLREKRLIFIFVWKTFKSDTPHKIVNWESAFPQSWLMIKAKRVFNELSIKNAPDKELLAVTQDRGVIPKKLCDQKYVSPSGKLDTLKLVQANDFVISLRSFQGGIEHSNYEGIVSPAYNIFSLNNQYKCIEYLRYYKYLFKTKTFIALLNTIISGVRDGKNINFSDFSEILIPVPPKGEINAFIKLFDRLESYKDLYTKEKKILEEYRDLLIADVVTGKVDVRDVKVPDVDNEKVGIEDISEIEEDVDEATVDNDL